MSAAHPGLGARIDAAAAVVTSLMSAGLALADPDLPGELRERAEDFAGSGLGSGADALQVLAGRLEDVSAAPAAERRAAARRAYDALQQLSTWVRTWRAVLALEVARERLGGAPAGPPPASARPSVDSRTVSVLGLETTHGRVRFHAIDTEDGGHVILEEPRPPGLELGPERTFPSRLLHRDVPLRALLDGTVAIGGLPAGRRRGRLEVQPSFSRPAVLCPTRAEVALPDGAAGRGPQRTTVRVRSTPDGFTLEAVDGTVLDVTIDEGLALDLVKRSAAGGSSFELSAVLLRGADTTVLLRLEDADGPSWPWLDAHTSLFDASLLRRDSALADLLASICRGAPGSATPADAPSSVAAFLAGRHGDAPPALPATPGAPLVEVAARALALPPADGVLLLDAHLANLRGRLAKGDPVPSGVSLWAVGHARARLVDAPTSPPFPTLALPVGRTRLAAAAPLARWLAGTGGRTDAVDGLLLAVICGVCDDLVAL